MTLFRQLTAVLHSIGRRTRETLSQALLAEPVALLRSRRFDLLLLSRSQHLARPAVLIQQPKVISLDLLRTPPSPNPHAPMPRARLSPSQFALDRYISSPTL